MSLQVARGELVTVIGLLGWVRSTREVRLASESKLSVLGLDLMTGS